MVTFLIQCLPFVPCYLDIGNFSGELPPVEYCSFQTAYPAGWAELKTC